MKIVFAPIDAKDFSGTYDPVTVKDYYGGPRSEKNTKVMFEAIAEYLERLDALQKEISEKFEPLLEDDSHIESNESFCRTQCLCEEKFCEAHKKYQHLYYT